MMKAIWIYLFLLEFIYFGYCVYASQIEDTLETEIDTRLPQSFVARKFKILHVRQDSFSSMICHDGEHEEVEHIPNWEVFATRYWYEYRRENCSCPMIPRGIATMVDWSLMVPCLFGNPNIPPKTVFVHTYMLPHFVESTLNFMDPSYRFVLITSGADLTVPRNTDVRYRRLRGFTDGLDGGKYFQTLVNDPRIIHWFCENHDLSHPRISTLPTGMAGDNPDSAWQDLNLTKNAKPLQQRPLRFFVSDRVRSGGVGQWALRAHILQLCAQSTLCMRANNFTIEGLSVHQDVPEISHEIFLQHMVSVPFIACAHGGGMDPSPKAWEAILHGTIPIIERTDLADAYEKLPVMFVNDWSELFGPDEEVKKLLQRWLEKLAPYYEKGSDLRQKTIDKLKTNYWMEQIYRHVNNYYQNNSTVDSRRTSDHRQSKERTQRRLRHSLEKHMNTDIF